MTNRESHNFEEGKNIWIKDNEDVFTLVKILKENENSYSVLTKDGKKKEIKKEDSLKTNPKKFDGIEDLSALSNLNEATVLHNLKKRYDQQLIYTYSGLFLVTMNPFKDLGIYSQKYLEKYSNSKKNELPPHIFAVANEAYTSMLLNRKNQSILITGESGAGKTENTKKVISFLAYIAGNGLDQSEYVANESDQVSSSIEMKIIHTNPILETFGNARTLKNYNSSRFGKFIKIAFDSGRITGATIEKYLLERSRVTNPNEGERNYHIFYQLLNCKDPELLKSLDLVPDIKKYKILKNTVENIPGVNDADEFKNTLNSMKILGFTDETVLSIFKIISAILHLGNIEFNDLSKGKKVYDENKAEIKDTTPVEKACKLLSIPFTSFIKTILNPISVLSNETLVRNRNSLQAENIINGFCKLLYENLFNEIIKILNNILRPAYTDNFIGVLDIAGFEIFEKNDFEQFCINFTNEKLQQFFNHHMFILEQEIYEKELIEWNYIDFGHDLSPTINLIEKNNPIGILAYLDEECLMPKGNENSLFLKLVQKLSNTNEIKSNHSDTQGKAVFKPLKFTNGFILKHYAGETTYELTGWLEKNKEPFFSDIFDLIHKSGNDFIQKLVLKPTEKEKKGFFRTVAQKHKEQLTALMNELNKTFPHFIRCILPNMSKRDNLLDNKFILHQLRCNGVLEGIRISRLGYPNRMTFDEFILRYQVIYPVYCDDYSEKNSNRIASPNKIENGGSDAGKKQYIKDLCTSLNISERNYKVGLTKVFFKQGILAEIEEIREQKLQKLIREIKLRISGYFTRRNLFLTERKRSAIKLLLNDFNKHLVLRNSYWWRIYQICKPLIDMNHSDNNKKELENQLEVKNREIAGAINEIEKIKRVNQSKEYENQQLKTEIKNFKISNNQLQDLNTALRAESSAQIEDLNKNCTEKTEKLNLLEKEHRDLQSSTFALQKEFENIINEKETQAKSIKEFENENQKLKEESSKVKSSLVHIQSEMAALKVKNKGELDTLIVEKDKKIIELDEKCGVLESFKSQLEKNVNNLKEQMVAKEGELKAKIQENKVQTDNLIAQTQKIQAQSAEIATLTQEQSKSTKQINEQVLTISNLKRNIDTMRNEIEDTNFSLQKAEDEERKLKNENAQLSNEMLARQITINDLNNKILFLESKISSDQETLSNETHIFNEKIKTLENINSALQKKLKDAKDSRKNDLKNKEDLLRNTITAHQKEIQTLQKDISFTTSENKALKLKISKYINENDNLKLLIDEFKNKDDSSCSTENVSDSRSELLQELNEKENECIKYKNELQILQERFTEEITECNKIINDLKQNEIKNINSKELIKMRNENKTQKKTIEDLIENTDRIVQKHLKHYRNEVVSLENEINEIKLTNSELSEKCNDLTLTNQHLNSKSEIDQNNLNFYKKTLEQLTTDSLNKNKIIISHENELSDLKNKNNNLKTSYDHQIKILQSKTEELSKKYEFSLKQIDSLNETKSKYEQDYKRLFSLIKESEEEKTLRNENYSLKEDLSNLNFEKNTLKNDNDLLKEKIDQINNHYNDLQNKMTSLKKQNDVLASEILFKESEIKDFNETVRELRENLQKSRESAISLKDLQNIKEEAVNESKQEDKEKYNLYKNKFEILEHENVNLRDQNDKNKQETHNLRTEMIQMRNEQNRIVREKEMVELRNKQLERELKDEQERAKYFLRINQKQQQAKAEVKEQNKEKEQVEVEGKR